MRSLQSFAVVFAIAAALTASCGGRTVRTTVSDSSTVDLSQLWIEPTDLQSRDLFAGPASPVAAPNAATPFTFVRADRSGYSPGYDVRDASGVEWDVKLGLEAQPEVVSSRILWAIGYHQLPTYYLSTWTMTGGPGGNPGAARFRPELADRKVVSDWSWHENEFVGTQPLKGLIVALLMLNSWDWKTSNNKIYELTDTGLAADATAKAGPRRLYVVRDLGASLGKTSSPRFLRWFGWRGAQGSRNDLQDFESHGFVQLTEEGQLDFHYKGIYGSLVDTLTAEDVVWTSQLLSRLSDDQWNDAFRAAGYPPDQASRYIAKLKSKIQEGLALKPGG